MGARLSSAPAGPSVQTGLGEVGGPRPGSAAGGGSLCPEAVHSFRGLPQAGVQPPAGDGTTSPQLAVPSTPGPLLLAHTRTPATAPPLRLALRSQQPALLRGVGSGPSAPSARHSQTQPDLSQSLHPQIPPPPNAITPAGRLLLCSSFARTSPAGSMLTVCMARTLDSSFGSCGPRWPYHQALRPRPQLLKAPSAWLSLDSLISVCPWSSFGGKQSSRAASLGDSPFSRGSSLPLCSLA